jgi:hypothetical protein
MLDLCENEQSIELHLGRLRDKRGPIQSYGLNHPW